MLSTATALTVSAASEGGTRYGCTSSDTHTLPLLSTTTAGDKLEIRLNGNYDVIVNENAGDSNAEIGTYYRTGDGATYVSTGSAWLVFDEVVTMKGEAALSADDSIGATSEEKIFDANYTVVQNIGDLWDSVTNNRLDMPFAGRLQFITTRAAQSQITFYLKLNGTAVSTTGSGSSSELSNQYYAADLAVSDYIEVFAYNDDASSQTAYGDAALDETIIRWELLKRLR